MPLYRWRGKLLTRLCSGDPYDVALAVSENCCCPPCVATCCCANPPYYEGDCLFYVRPPECCKETACVTPPDDPNISGQYYQGGQTQIVNYKNFVYSGTAAWILNFPPNDYALSAVFTQNQPSWLSFSYCIDKARYEWHFLPGCTFYIPICVESYIRDPYCSGSTLPGGGARNCNPCADIFDDCCGSTFNSISQSQFAATMTMWGNNDANECPRCGNANPPTCIPYPYTACRTSSGPFYDFYMYLFDFQGCAGSVTKKCCFTTTGTVANNRRYYTRAATIASATLVGATECDGTDNNPGGIGSPYNPTQDTFSCVYPTY